MSCAVNATLRASRSSFAMTRVALNMRQSLRASCFWDESERDSRIGEILNSTCCWAEASRRWQSRIRKTCAIG